MGLSHQTTNTGADIKNTPKPSKVPTLLLLDWVRHHDGTLCGPEQTCADTEEGAGEDVETGDISMFGDEKTNGVNAVTDSTEGERETDTETVDDCSGEETHHGKGTVQGDVLLLLESGNQCDQIGVSEYCEEWRHQ